MTRRRFIKKLIGKPQKFTTKRIIEYFSKSEDYKKSLMVRNAK